MSRVVKFGKCKPIYVDLLVSEADMPTAMTLCASAWPLLVPPILDTELLPAQKHLGFGANHLLSGKLLAPEMVSPIIPTVYAVLDTSVLVSGLRSNRGASFEILRAIRSGALRIAVSVGLVLEYESVALRPGLIPDLSSEEIQSIIDVLCRLAHQQRVFYTWRPFLSDADDDLILELAVAAGTEYIITHNRRDFAGSDSMGIRAITPAEALSLI